MKPTARAPRVAVLKPGSSNIGILVIDTQLEVRDSLDKANASKDTRDTGSDDNDSQRPSFVNRPVFENGLVVL